MKLVRGSAIVIVLLCATSLSTPASTAFLRVPSNTAPELAPVRTYAGNVESSVKPIKFDAPVTAVVLADTLTAEHLDLAKSELLSLQASLRGHPLRIAMIRNGAVGMAGPFSTRAKLKGILDEISPATDAASQPAPASFFDLLAASVSQWEADGSHVVLIGDFPDVDASTADYAAAVLLRTFVARHLQVSWFAPAGGGANWFPAFQATGGKILQDSLSGLPILLNNSSQTFVQVDWTPAAPSQGFVVSRTVIPDQQGNTLGQVPDISASATASLPTIELYADMEKKAGEAAALLTQQPLTEASAKQIHEKLESALDVDSRDTATLRVAAAFYEQLKDYATAAKLRSALVEVRPADGSTYAALGHVSLLSGDLDKADAALRRALELNATTPLVSEDLAKVHLARKEDKEAIPFLDAALAADGKRQDLWFLEADAAQGNRDSSLAIRAFEQGLALGGAHVQEASSLLRLYASTKQDAKAADLAGRMIPTLPPDLNLRERFATALDDLRLANLALDAWKRVLEVQPNREIAHLRIARILLESGNAAASEKAADAGLAVAAKSAGLYLVKADALEAQREIYKARKTLEEGAGKIADPALLSRLAVTEDAFGDSAAASYARLADSLDAQTPNRESALERGLVVSLRDGDFGSAKAFESKLEASGQNQFHGLLEEQSESDEYEVIPGGLDALAFAAHMPEHIPPEKFLLEYCQTIVTVFGQAAPADKKILESGMQDHFARIAELEPFGKKEGDKLVIPLSLNNKNLRKNTEKVLAILGIKLRRNKGETDVEQSEKKSQSTKQETAAALAIDEVGMQEAFQAGKPYAIEIPYEKATVYPGRKLWQEAFYGQAGFVIAAMREPKMASLYIALSYLDRRTVSSLLSAVSLKVLAERYSDLMYLFSPAFAVENGRAMVPGGTKAERIWADLVGANPAEPGAFFRALLDRDGGKLLGFFFTLSQLDRAHQAFFTDHESRTAQFYKLFASSKEMERGAQSVTTDSPLRELLRGVPLDKNGRVNFPGSAQVWMVAKGRSLNVGDTSKLLKKVSKVAPPEVEDEVLLRLGETQYAEHGAHVSELDNFLAVVRIDAHRSKPLDEESALLLAQRYSGDSSSYPYFTDLTALGATEFKLFFSAIDRIKGYAPLEINLRLGEFHALIEWICLMNRRGAIDDDDAAQLFKFVCDRFGRASAGAAYTAASLESARAILAHCSRGEDKASADEQLRACLLDPTRAAGKRGEDYQRVLEDQKAPSLSALLSIYDAISKLSANSPPGPVIASAQKALAGLPSAGLPKDSKVRGKEKDAIERFETAPAIKLGAELAEKAAKRKVNRGDIDKLSTEILAEIEPQVELSLAGPIYAYFLRSTDLVESADNLLLRKHHYFSFALGDRQDVNLESYFHKDAEGVGSYFDGGFAEFPLAAASAATTGWKDSAGAGESAVAELAAIRATVWEHLDESDQRLLSLRILAAREWIFESASHPELFHALGDETLGALSLTRRADLLNGIETRNWGKVWDALTLPDLLSLGGRYLEHFDKDPWSSPVTTALRYVAAKNDGSHLQVLGPLTYRTFGCGHPHLLVDSPYEEYARQLIPQQIAERSAEFKLFLAFLADRAGLEPGSLESVAEPLVGKAFRGAKMASPGDWRALLTAYASLTPDDLKRALEQ